MTRKLCEDLDTRYAALYLGTLIFGWYEMEVNRSIRICMLACYTAIGAAKHELSQK